MADQRVNPGPEKGANRAARHHDARDFRALRFAEHLGQQRNADDDLGSGADAGEEAIQTEIEQADRKPLHRGEKAIEPDAEHQRPHPADIVGQNAKNEPTGGPAEQAGHDQEAAIFADLGHLLRRQQPGRGKPQQLTERRLQHQREQPEIGRIERPAQPYHQKH